MAVQHSAECFTRRRLLAWVVAGISLPRPGYALAPFWDTKEPSAWSPEEVHRMLTRSPWAKSVTAIPRTKPVERTTNTRTPGPGRGGRGGISVGGGGGGGGRSNPTETTASSGDASSGGRGRNRDDATTSEIDLPPIDQHYKGVVRWENAKPLRDAARFALPAEFDGHLVIGLGGFPFGDVVDVSGVSQVSPRDVLHIASGSTLGVKGRKAVHPRMGQFVHGIVLLGFSRDALEFAPADNDVVFASYLERMTIRATFHLKDMIYRGAPAT